MPRRRPPSVLPTGKLSVALLRRLLARGARRRDRRLVVGPGIGLDAAVIDLGPRYLVAKTDPITFLSGLSGDLGAYVLTINANDLAVTGATPRWFLATILLPARATRAREVTRLFAHIRRSCRRLGVTLSGGHTEITDAVTRPVVAGCLLGECPKGRLITAAGAKVGDALLLTKGIPIEAVSVLARERSERIRRQFGAAFLARCRRYVTKPGISVLRDAAVALRAGGVHAMHDPTEGGLSAALSELAEASEVGLQVDLAALRILPEGTKLCKLFGLNPLGAIASGALLISAASTRADGMLRRLSRAGIPAARIGLVVPRRHGVRLTLENGRTKPLPRFPVDELARILS